MSKKFYISLNLFFKFQTGGTKHYEMLVHRYTVFLVDARREYHIERVLIYKDCLYMFKILLFYHIIMCEEIFKLHIILSTEGRIEAMYESTIW